MPRISNNESDEEDEEYGDDEDDMQVVDLDTDYQAQSYAPSNSSAAPGSGQRSTNTA